MGFFGEDVETFAVTNQPLFAYPDLADVGGIALYSMQTGEDFMAHFQRAMISNFGRADIHKLINTIRGGITPTIGVPKAGPNVLAADGCRVGIIRAIDWACYHLAVANPSWYIPATRQINMGGNAPPGHSAGSGGANVPAPPASTSTTSTPARTAVCVAISNPAVRQVGAGGFVWKPESDARPGAVVLFPKGSPGGAATFNGETGSYRGLTNGGRPTTYFSKTGGNYAPGSVCTGTSSSPGGGIGGDDTIDADEGTVAGADREVPNRLLVLAMGQEGDEGYVSHIVSSTIIPRNIPEGNWRIGDGYNGSPVVLEKVSDDLFSFGDPEGTLFLPPLPIRVANSNYYDGGSAYDEDDIDKIAKIMRVDATDIIDAVMESPDVQGNEHKIDNVFVNTGIRLWDTSRAGAKYLYLFFDQMEQYHASVGNPVGTDECEFVADPEHFNGGGILDNPGYSFDSSCHEISIETEDFYCEFRYSVISRQQFSLSQVMADDELKLIYFADSSKFTGGRLRKEYFSTSAAAVFACGYIASNDRDVDRYAATGKCKRSVPHVPDDHPYRDFLKVDGYIRYNSVIYDWDSGAPIDESELRPGLIYYQQGGALYRMAVTNEDTDAPLLICRVHAGGLEAIVLLHIGCFYRCKDEATGTVKYAIANSGDPSELVVPFCASLMPSLNNTDVGSLYSASLHITILVADIEYVRLPWWAVLLKVIMIIVMVVASYFGLTSVAAMTWQQVMKMVIYYVIAAIVVRVASSISPYLGLAAGAIAWALAPGNSTNFGASLSELFANLAVNLLEVLNTIMMVVSKVISAYVEGDMLSLSDEADGLGAEHRDAYRELGGEAFVKPIDEGMLESLQTSIRTEVVPFNPGVYFDMVDDFHEIGIHSLDVEHMIEDPFDLDAKLQPV